MKIKDGYLLKNVASVFVVVSVGDLDFDGLIQLNETGAFLWSKLENHCTADALISDLCKEYEIDRETASKDVNAFLDTLKENKLIDE